MKRQELIINCAICGKEVSTTSSRKRKYCSHNCYAIARANGIYPPYWKNKKRSSDTVAKQSKLMKAKYASRELEVWCKGKKLSAEHRKKLSEAKKGVYIGFLHPNWEGGRRADERGYIRIWIAPKKWRYEHNLIMENKLGRPLQAGEVVHHIDGDRGNNSIDNLALFPSSSAHLKHHRLTEGKVRNQYGEWDIKHL